MTLQIFWPKPGNPREGGQKGGTNGREGGGEGGSRAKPGNQLVYIYNSVLTCRQHIINSSANAPPNATKIAVKKGSDVVVCMFGPEL